MRDEYPDHVFTSEMAGDEPMQLFVAWFEEACRSERVAEANAMTLATANQHGIPSARMVLLKGVDRERGAFTWFTNLESDKASEALDGASVALGGPPSAAIAWWWPGSGEIPSRQVRASGIVERVSRDEARIYFASRPFEARVAGTVSRQSKCVESRASLEERFHSTLSQYQGSPDLLELPNNWGGLRLVADRIEFWQGRTNRLHDRICFKRDAAQQGTGWRKSRLEP